QEFGDGGAPVGELQQLEATEETGTVQTFWADGTIFETIEYDFETLRSRMQQYAFLNKSLQITITDERANGSTADEVAGEDDHAEAEQSERTRTVTYKYDGGLIDYVKHLTSAKRTEVIHPEVIDFESEDTERKISLEIAMQ